MPSRRRPRKSALYDGLAVSVKALANPHRLEILELLAQVPRTVEAVGGLARLSVANASQHLQVLRVAGLVESEKRGSFVTYRLAGDDVAAILVRLRELSHARTAAMARIADELREKAAPFEELDRLELLERARRGEVVVVDVRPAEEYAAGHIPGARSIPLRELKGRLAELPKRTRVVAYCRGPYCVLAANAVDVLSRAGFKALHLTDGVAEWRARGLPIESGSTTEAA